MKVTFQRRYSVPQKDIQKGKGLTSVECYGTNCWAVGPAYLLRSEDSGKTWTNSFFSSPLPEDIHPFRVGFYTEKEGLLLAQGRVIVYYRTEDAGRTWSQVRRLDDEGHVWAELCAIREPKLVWSLIKRRDRRAFVEIMDVATRTWIQTPVTILGAPRQILFEDGLNGWMVERWNENSWIEGSPQVERTMTVLHHSQDGGATWRIICKKDCAGIRLRSLGSRKLVMVAEDGIFLSEDEGKNWVRCFDPPRVPLYDAHFLGTVGGAVGTEGLIESKSDVLLLFSRDSGKTWLEIEAPSASAFLGIRLITWSSGILASTDAIYTFQLS